MKLAPKPILAALCGLLLLAAGSPDARAATISISGRIQGRINADYEHGNVCTMDFYFVELAHPASVSVTWCVTSGPGDDLRTSLDLDGFPYTDPFADLSQFAGAGAAGGLGCRLNSFSLPAGRYVFSVATRAGFDGDGGVTPLTESDSGFAYFDYAGTITGDVNLTAIWKGQPGDTFLKTNVPEPGLSFSVLSGVTVLLLRFRFPAA